MTEPKIPSTLPPLPPPSTLPWSAEIINAHRGLVSAFETSYRALNLDESDPIRLGHHLKQAETFIASIVDVLSIQTDNPFPPEYVEVIRRAVALLVDGLRVALSQATSAFVISLYVRNFSSYHPKRKIKCVEGPSDHHSEEWEAWSTTEGRL